MTSRRLAGAVEASQLSLFLLMVTEMAGGYHLLVPAGLAVMISYLLQVRLSYFLKCQSLCEGQVPTPQDSPAHYMEQIKLALDLLGKGKLQFTNELGHIDLLRLLRSRIRFDLPGGRELTIGIVEQESPLSGRPIKTLYQRLEKYDFEIIAIMRREHVLLPHPDTLMKPGDRLILITSPAAGEPLSECVKQTLFVEEGGPKAQSSKTG